MGSPRGGTQKKGLGTEVPGITLCCEVSPSSCWQRVPGSPPGVELGSHRGVYFPVTNGLSISELSAVTSFQRDPHFAISLPCPSLDVFLIRAPKRAEFGMRLFCALSRAQSGGETPAAH